MSQTKTCTKCTIEKPVTEFGVASATKKDGYNSWCKQCCRDSSKRNSKTASGIYSGIKSRQRYCTKHLPRRHKPFIISREEFIEWYEKQERRCVYCDVPEEKLDDYFDAYNVRSNRLTIDCVDNDRGYVGGNLVLSCKRCNDTKSDLFSFDEMRYIGETFIKPKWERLLREQR